MNVKAFYETVGGDYADAVSRFQNDALIKRFLRMIEADDSFPKLEKAVIDENAHDAFFAVHTLKGFSLNLSLTDFASVCSEMSEVLRDRETLPEDTLFYFERVRTEYRRIINALKLLDA